MPGTAETRLRADELAGLATDVPGAPWTCRVDALLWWRVAGRPVRAAARAALPPAVRASAAPLVRVGALVRYHHSPVGPYSEVLGAVGLLGRAGPALHVPFIAVDSAASLVAGRRSWALPKVLGVFDGDARGGAVRAAGRGWGVTAVPHTSRVAAPGAGALRLLQQGPDARLLGAFVLGRGRVAAARVDVAVTGDGLTGWFPAGRCWGAVVSGGLLRLRPPSAPAPTRGAASA
ncbi:acetoacetate decarboxylase family protein [Georgenia sp. SYP-B2076]|uniref:acetoacetate decarboxylase family protein n=1 Tax=Georgenia sp. SYP-B2076 TaxID=2495881 RepID=UPI00197AE2CA|nr:acetoacetate decarboxylase family protein [Georgenia sp. SYP-B2076]